MVPEERIKEIVCEIAEVDVDTIDPEASFFEDMGLNSLRMLEILAAIEDEFDIAIDPEKLEEVRCLNDVIKLAKEYLN